MSINSLPIQGAKQTLLVGFCCQLATHTSLHANTHTHSMRLIYCSEPLPLTDKCVRVPYRGVRFADWLMLVRWMKLLSIGEHNELPGISRSQTHQLTAIVATLQSQGTLDRINWVRLRQQSEGLWASPQKSVCEKQNGAVEKIILWSLLIHTDEWRRDERKEGKIKWNKMWSAWLLTNCSIFSPLVLPFIRLGSW